MGGLITAINILIIENDEQDIFLLKEILRSSGLLIEKIIVENDLEGAAIALKNDPADIILYGLTLHDTASDCSVIQHLAKQVPVIHLINAADESKAYETIKYGALDFFLKKELDAKALQKSICCSIERKFIRETLRITGERYYLIATNTNDMVWDWDLVNKTLFRNEDGIKKLLKGRGDEMISPDEWNDRVHPGDVAQLKNVLVKSLEDIAVDFVECEYRLLTFEDEYIYVKDKGYIIRNNRGEATRIMGVTRNITKRRLDDDAVRSSEEKYRNLFNNNPAAIFIWDIGNMHVLEVNDAAVKEYGYSREEFLSLNVVDLCIEEERAKLKQLSFNILQNEQFRSTGIWMHVTKSGTRLFMNVSFHGVDYHGKKACLVIAYNMTDQVELEMKLATERLIKQQEITAAVIKAQEQEREELGRELHDNINQILATTRLYIEYAQTNEKQRNKFLDSSKEFIKKAVSEIRNLSKSLLPPSLGEIGLVMAVEELVNSLQQVHECNFNIEWVHFEESIIAEQLKLTIFRIIQEQFNNIITHAHAKNVWIKIIYQHEHLLVSVKDDGVGFNIAEKRTGVGLKNITSRADLHHGTVHLHSEKGHGCEIRVSFPLHKN